MNILVIGGTRFMGKHLIANLLSNNHKVTIATRGIALDDFDDKIDRITFERTDENSIKEKLSSVFFDIVFDSLAYCSNDIKILLSNIKCKKYITISTTAVYQKHVDTKEEEFNPNAEKLIWCGRTDFPYEEIKRQAERALAQIYSSINTVSVRFPFVIGEDDYTKRLYFYIEHIIKQKPMFVDNYDKQMAFVRADEAGRFLAFFADNEFTGAVNGASEGTISIKEITEYVKHKTGKSAILCGDGDKAPYNGEVEYSINTDKAKTLGFNFSPLKNWIYDLIDNYIAKTSC